MNAQTPTEPVIPAPRKKQLRGPLSVALDVIAMEGQTQREAARRAGMNETALSRALAKPHIIAELEDRKAQAAMGLETIKGMAQISAYRVGLDLMHNSPDHKVRAKMVELFTGETRQAPVAVQINNHAPGGYTYSRTDPQSGAQSDQAIDITPKDNKA